jgi:hypothetical protein
MKTTEKQYRKLEIQVTKLLKSLKGDIGDDYRASDDPNDTTPGMCVTIGATPDPETGDLSWHYQTGDNSFTGGAYGHRNWGVIYLYRRSRCEELASEAVSEIANAMAYDYEDPRTNKVETTGEERP